MACPAGPVVDIAEDVEQIAFGQALPERGLQFGGSLLAFCLRTSRLRTGSPLGSIMSWPFSG